MAISELQLNNFKDLFVGNTLNYGRHMYAFANKQGDKEKGTNSSIKNKLLTIKEYRQHLNGVEGLGIIPIDADNMSKFAVIDIDVYNQDFKPYLEAIERHNFPLVPFYSKSGGLHIYVFFRDRVRSKDAVDRLKKISRILGITLFVKQHKNEALEIFPKQTKLSVGQMGNWINLPYYNAEDTKQSVILNGKALDFNSALMHMKSKLTSIIELDELLDDLPYNDAPPCLQTLYLLSMLGENNGRNNYLFSFGVYLKKKDENYFEQAVMKINNELEVPLETKEVEETLLSSLRKKDYTYMCTTAPCVDFCDKKVCQKREYGIGQMGGYFSNLIFGDMVQYQTASPYYEWEVKGQDVAEFKILRFKNEDEVIKQDVFLRLCFRELRFLPFKMKQTEWFKLVNQALTSIKFKDVDKEDDTSPEIRFHNAFYEFLTARAPATTKDQIFGKRVYFSQRDDRFYFRTKDFVTYLYEYKNFRLFSSGEVHGMLRDIGVLTKVLRTETGKQIRVMGIIKDKVHEEYKSVPDNYEVDFSEYEEKEEF